MLDTCVRCTHTARSGQEEPCSQGTAQGERRGRIRPERSPKLGGQDTPAAVGRTQGREGFSGPQGSVGQVCMFP